MSKTMSRVEDILNKYDDVQPLSRVEALLIELIQEGGTSDVQPLTEEQMASLINILQNIRR